MAETGALKQTAEYFAARALLGALGAMPRVCAVACGRGVGWLAYKLAGGLRRVGRRNLELAFPEKTAAERERLLRGCFATLGRVLGEVSQFNRATPEKLRKIIEFDAASLAQLREAKATGRGIIFLTGHLGAWELLSFGWSALEYPISFLVRPLDNERVDKMVENIRTRFGNRAISKRQAARVAIRTLREGQTLGILADLNALPHEGVFVPFFGHQASATTGVATLALMTDAIVFPVCAVWDKAKGRYVFYGGPPVELTRTGNNKRDIETNTARFAQIWEEYIRRWPEQWMWIHKRWKTRPDGEADFYRRDEG
jgi:KDO2-lipid IV(A) lauroyltransferase